VSSANSVAMAMAASTSGRSERGGALRSWRVLADELPAIVAGAGTPGRGASLTHGRNDTGGKVCKAPVAFGGRNSSSLLRLDILVDYRINDNECQYRLTFEPSQRSWR